MQKISVEQVMSLVASVLQIESRLPLFNGHGELTDLIPELDSMAVVSILNAFESVYGFTIEDDELSATTFQSFTTLTHFVNEKLVERPKSPD